MDAEKSYDDYWLSGKHVAEIWDEEVFEKWLSPLKGKGRVLDYGCGPGISYQQQLIANCEEYTGADVSRVALDDLQRKGLRGLKIAEDSTIDAPDAYFDGIVCSEVMEHLWDPLAAAKELARVLKPGGVLVSTVPNFGYLPFRLLALFRAEVWSEPEDPVTDPFKGVHIRYFSLRSFGMLYRMAGFSEVEVGNFDKSNVFDFFKSVGMQRLGGYLDIHLPNALRLSWLHKLSPSLFGLRLRAVCIR